MNPSEKKSLAEQVKLANREIYNQMTPERYNANESIFNQAREEACDRILQDAAARSGDGSYLDVGTGTGNLLRISRKRFQRCFGVDIGENLLAQIQNDFPECLLSASDAENLPFKADVFNCVSCYALLHHLLEHENLFREVFRVLKPGGTLYTDHDPNYFFTRFYHLYYRIRFANKPGFGTETEELAEYHNSKSSGINPEELKRILLGIGFKEVFVNYRNTDRENWGMVAKILVGTQRKLARVIPWRGFFTHFSIIAVK